VNDHTCEHCSTATPGSDPTGEISAGATTVLLMFTSTGEFPAPVARKHERPRRYDLLVDRPRKGGVASA